MLKNVMKLNAVSFTIYKDKCGIIVVITEYKPPLSTKRDEVNTITSMEAVNNSLLEFLYQTQPAYVDVVPHFWLTQEQPDPSVQLYFSIFFLIICIPGNISQLLVLAAYFR